MGEKNTKVTGGWNYFIFIYIPLAIMVADTAFRKYHNTTNDYCKVYYGS